MIDVVSLCAFLEHVLHVFYSPRTFKCAIHDSLLQVRNVTKFFMFPVNEAVSAVEVCEGW